MRILRGVIYGFLVVLCVAVVPALAQGDCPTLVQSAIKAVGDLCATTGLNQACYGNLSLKADPQPGVTGFAFDKPGDVTRVANLQTLRVDPFDAATNKWGVALMRLQANIPDTLPGQSVSFLVFGDVQLENKVKSVESPLMSMPSNMVLLGEPKADAAVVGGLGKGDKVYLLSQSDDSQWVRVELDGSDSRSGWIPASVVQQAGELPKFDAEAPAPMQAFSLQTGVSGVKCASAPQDGILVQTPGGRGDLKIKLTVNDVNVELGSTAFMQAAPDSFMRFSILEGAGKVESKGQSVDVPAGTWVSIPMDGNLQPLGTISQPKAYNESDMEGLPISLLGRPITIAPSIANTVTNLCVSNPNGAWIRQQPSSANQTILRVLAAGNTVTDFGSTANDGSQDWRQVQTTDQQVIGWVEAVSLSNCGTTVSVSTPSVTGTPGVLENCTPRADWQFTYTVQSGNTLAEVARASGVSLADLAQGNCIADVNRINAGQQLRVPKLAIIVTPLPPLQVNITPTPTFTLPPPSPQPASISSGRWTITAYLQYQNCPNSPTPQASTQVVPVTVNADGSALTIISNNETVNFRRVQDTVYVGTVPSLNASATLNVTVPSGANSQAVMQMTAPCPTGASTNGGG